MIRSSLIALILVALAACGRSQPSAKSVSPVLAEYRALYGEIGEDTSLLTAHVYPHKPGLELDDMAPGGMRDRLLATLERLQPQIKRIVELSRQPIGPFPPEPQEASAEQWPRAWVNRCAEVLQADAGRLWDAGRPDDAVVRLTAQIRIGDQMMRGPESLMQMWGLARAGAAAIRANAIFDAGALIKISPDHRAALAEAARAVQVSPEQLQGFDKLAPQVQTEVAALLNRLDRP